MLLADVLGEDARHVETVALGRLNANLRLGVCKRFLRVLSFRRPIFGTALDSTLIKLAVINVVAVVFGCMD